MDKIYNLISKDSNTSVYAEAEYQYNAPHEFYVKDNAGNIVQTIHFQEGAIKEVGINGVSNENLICMVLERLQSFQKSSFSCRENAIAITKLEEALLWLDKRTRDRQKRNVEGTMKV